MNNDQLRAIIERIELQAAVIADHQADLKEIYAEAVGSGFDKKVLRKVIAMRKRSRDDLAEEEAILETYCAALGMI